MPRFLANLSMLFTELPFLERFAAARRAGFHTVEVQFPYEHAVADIRHALIDAEVSLYLINLPAGNWADGDRGVAADPARVQEFRDGVARAIEYAGELGVRHLNCLAGRRSPAASVETQWATLVANVRYAAAQLCPMGATLLVEPVNRRDIPDFFLGTSTEALRLLDAAGEGNLALQYDVYHMQRGEGELAETTRANLARIGHIQIADTPGRHQPGTGEINFRYLLQELDRMGYGGYVSLEYIPTPDTLRSLTWIGEYGFTLSQDG
jgi:hydroxypyruvate isomerase